MCIFTDECIYPSSLPGCYARLIFIGGRLIFNQSFTSLVSVQIQMSPVFSYLPISRETTNKFIPFHRALAQSETASSNSLHQLPLITDGCLFLLCHIFLHHHKMKKKAKTTDLLIDLKHINHYILSDAKS